MEIWDRGEASEGKEEPEDAIQGGHRLPGAQGTLTKLCTWAQERGCPPSSVPSLSPPFLQADQGRVLTSRRRRTTSVLPHKAASCNAVPAFVCRLMSIPDWSRSLQEERGQNNNNN